MSQPADAHGKPVSEPPGCGLSAIEVVAATRVPQRLLLLLPQDRNSARQHRQRYSLARDDVSGLRTGDGTEPARANAAARFATCVRHVWRDQKEPDFTESETGRSWFRMNRRCDRRGWRGGANC